MMDQRKYDVIIVGGGVVGTALLYTLCRYTDVKSIALVEKAGDIGMMSSFSRTNSQTLHFGDVETNYTKEKASQTNDAARMILAYAKSNRLPPDTVQRCQKLLLASGEDEIEYAAKWYSSFAAGLYPGLRVVGKEETVRMEPNLLKGRGDGERVVVYSSNTGYMVDFGRLAKSFVENSKDPGKKIDIMLNTEVHSIYNSTEGYSVDIGNGRLEGKSVVASAGIDSLRFAKSLGLAKDIGIIPTGGGFFVSKKVLNGKVYRVQMGKMPFAAVHGDPDITDASITRFGPVIYLPVDASQIASAPVSLRILGKYDLYGLISRHMSYWVPVIGKDSFVRNEVAKIVPSIKHSDVTIARGYGGISPRIVDLKTSSLSIGEERIRHNGAIFNIAPSPGASSSLAIAASDASYISRHLGVAFDSDRLEKELKAGS